MTPAFQPTEKSVCAPRSVIKNLSCKKGDVSDLHVPYKVNRFGRNPSPGKLMTYALTLLVLHY